MWWKELWNVHTMEYSTAVRKNEDLHKLVRSGFHDRGCKAQQTVYSM